MKEYYNKILTAPFDSFFNFNNECALKSKSEINIEPNKDLPADSLTSDITSENSEVQGYGLYNGKMGLAIILYLRGVTDQAEQNLEDTIKYVENGENIKISFDDGLLGIAWGISFLIENKMIDGNIDEILSDFDDIIFNYFDMGYYGNWSFEKGFLGLIYYSTMRLYQNKNIIKKYPVFFKLLNKILREKYTNESSNLIEMDFPFIVLLFMSFHDEKCKIIDNITSINILLYVSDIIKEHKNSVFYKGIKSIKPM
ncbi:hypothetical protein FACS1894174_06470 [Bacteroidia bacterium]|nr:hypothetical protein FACS1894174_06470 [Bacteroidia bacterium]